MNWRENPSRTNGRRMAPGALRSPSFDLLKLKPEKIILAGCRHSQLILQRVEINCGSIAHVSPAQQIGALLDGIRLRRGHPREPACAAGALNVDAQSRSSR